MWWNLNIWNILLKNITKLSVKLSDFTSYKKQWKRIAGVVEKLLETKILMSKELNKRD